MRSDTTLVLDHAKVRALVRGLASSCGSALNSGLVVLGDRFGLYKTGQYGADQAGPGSPTTTLPIPRDSR